MLIMVYSTFQRRVRNFIRHLRNEKGEINMVAIVLIILVVIALIAIFKENLISLLNSLFQKIKTEAEAI